jgi:hypothetical protein
VELTFYFKEYLESRHPDGDFRIIGKTSTEIMNELTEISTLNNLLDDINKWLTECDRMKFTGVNATVDQKKGHYNDLVYLVKKINSANDLDGGTT